MKFTRFNRLCGFDSHHISNDHPLHRYGSIVLRPSLDDELTTLFELIFEYKEGSDSIEVGEPKEKNTTRDVFYNEESQITQIHHKAHISKRPITMNACWDSTIDQITNGKHSVTIQPQLTLGGHYKYYVTCSCGARRYESFCLGKDCRHEIIKHDTGNYHDRYRNPFGYQTNKWDYTCPYCGRGASEN